MENQSVARYSLSLLETMQEGISYIKTKLNNNDMASTANLLTDIITAFSSLEIAMSQIEDLPKKDIENETQLLKQTLDMLVKEYENSQIEGALGVLKFSVEPSFKSWKEELERVLKPYILQ